MVETKREEFFSKVFITCEGHLQSNPIYPLTLNVVNLSTKLETTSVDNLILESYNKFVIIISQN